MMAREKKTEMMVRERGEEGRNKGEWKRGRERKKGGNR